MIFLARFLILNILMTVLDILKSLEGSNDKSKNVSIFKPNGESFKVRFIVKMIVLLDKLKLLKIFLNLYSKI